MQETGVPRQLMHLPSLGSSAYARVVSSDIGTGEDQRGLRSRQDLRSEVL